MAIKIRQASKKDKDIAIILRYLLQEYESVVEKSENLNKRIALRECRYARSDLNDKNIYIFLAYYNNMPVGYSKIKIKKIKGEIVGHVGADFVLREFRNLGIGKRLMKAMVNVLKKKKIGKISLKVFKSNKLSINIHKKRIK